MPGWDKLPMVNSEGDLFALMTPRDCADAARAMWRAGGGWERMLHMVENDDDKFWELSKRVMLDQIPKPTQDVKVDVGIDDLWLKLAKRDKQPQVIEGEATVVEAEPVA